MNDLSAHGLPKAVVLLAEDNDNDAELVKLAFRHSGFSADIRHVTDGEECLQFLRKTNRYIDAPTPDLILLDLNMPRMSGLEVLSELAKDAALRPVPAVVLTTSEDPTDVTEAYRRHCNSYIVKPDGFDALVETVKLLSLYWLQVTVRPKQQPLLQTSADYRSGLKPTGTQD